MTLFTFSGYRQRITFKIVGILLVSLVMALTSIAYTLLLSWQLEGGAAAINDAGSLRMRSYRLALTLERYVAAPHDDAGLGGDVRAELGRIEETLHDLSRGDPRRPLFIPQTGPVQLQLQQVLNTWRQVLRPQVYRVLDNTDPLQRRQAWLHYRDHVDGIVTEIHDLVARIERDNAGKTLLLRSFQMVLLGMAFVGTFVMIQLMLLWIIRPILRLQNGMERMAKQDFSVRLQVESQDEFGQLAQGFNQMADKLEGLYSTLESRVQTKTAKLAEQNRELSCLYEITTFLNEQQSVEDSCRGFLARIIRHFEADGGTVRALDPLGERAHILVNQGLSEALISAEHCLKTGDCLCGEAVQSGVSVVHDMRTAKVPKAQTLNCAKEGFTTVSVFHIKVGQQQLGFFNLHFREPKQFSREENHLLETLGQHLGVAMENQRLAAREREMAVAEERNLMAQGLHDSIAQGLNFLNLQVQMLNDSLQRGALEEARDVVPLLQAGVQESYADVRELLNNFRSRLQGGDLVATIAATLDKFHRQTGIATRLDHSGDGAPLPAEQQLQVLFILQEALSNVRKHAAASRVAVRLETDIDIHLSIRDNGQGFDPEEAAARGDQHVGLKIMRERASRIEGSLAFNSTPGSGTQIELLLPRRQRLATTTTEKTSS